MKNKKFFDNIHCIQYNSLVISKDNKENVMMKQILFDLDGTLTDSGEGIMHCFELSLSHLGLPVPPRSQLRSCVGPPLRDSFRRFGVREEAMEQAVLCYRDHYNLTGQFENFPYPGIEKLLIRLKESGCRLYVATSKPEGMSVEILTRYGLSKYFDIICGATPDGTRNTKEAVIAYLLAQMDSRENLLMVGDTIFDIVGANAHRIPAIGVSWGYGDCREMLNAGAIGIAHTIQELYDRIMEYSYD